MLETFLDKLINHPKTTIAGIVGAVVSLLVIFGIPVDDSTKNTIIDILAIVVPIVIGFWAHDPQPTDG